MEPEGSLPHSQASATCLYPEPAQSSPHPLETLPPGEPTGGVVYLRRKKEYSFGKWAIQFCSY